MIERVEGTVGNCSRSLIFKMNLWKGVLEGKHCAIIKNPV